MNTVFPRNPFRLVLISVAASVCTSQLLAVNECRPPVPALADIEFELRIAETEPRENPLEAAVDSTGEIIWLHGSTVATRRDVSATRTVGSDVMKRYEVDVRCTKSGAARLAQATATNINRRMAIIVDGPLRMAPRIVAPFSTASRLSHSFTRQEAEPLAAHLLPAARPNIVLIHVRRYGIQRHWLLRRRN